MRTKVLVVAAALFTCAAPLHAQYESNGITVGVGVGAGWGRVSCDFCQTSRDLGPTGYLRIGTAMGPNVSVAAEATAWTHEVEDERENLGALMAMLYLHSSSKPLYFKGGLGYVGYRAGDEISLNTVGMQIGAGYELRLGGLAVHNYLNLLGSSFGSLKSEGTTIAEDVSTTLVQIGVGFSLR